MRPHGVWMLNPVQPAAQFWKRDDVAEALRGRDMSALFRLLRKHAGASQMRIAITTGLTTNRVSLIMNGRSSVTALATFERIAIGLDMPDDARLTLGIAPRRQDR